MWGSLSKSDERYYRRKKEEIKNRFNRLKETELDMPRRKAILARVKAGDITLTDARRLISKPNS
jgi:hypothetical protein